MLAFFRRPSKAISLTLGISAILVLLFKPLPGGDGLANRLNTSMNPTMNNPLAVDGQGNNIFSVLANQVLANIPDALGLIIPAALIGWAGRVFRF